MTLSKATKTTGWTVYTNTKKRKSAAASCLMGVAAVIFVCVLTSTNALAETGKRGSEHAVKRGKKLFEAHCQSCHGKNGVGQPPIPWSIRNPKYITPPALDDSQHAWHHSDENLIKTILEGSPRTSQMPAWKNVLSRRDAADLVAYMKSLWSDRALACQGPKHMSCM
jgi:mono/diheme cytochrome c family protein